MSARRSEKLTPRGVTGGRSGLSDAGRAAVGLSPAPAAAAAQPPPAEAVAVAAIPSPRGKVAMLLSPLPLHLQARELTSTHRSTFVEVPRDAYAVEAKGFHYRKAEMTVLAETEATVKGMLRA
eukprot:CAMPEP_0178407772 /NCGR_PEP_ID=MMETSP0689_2-20121128/19599_1 /TAXON_ID=160604 /ORGANISM="Amphidinium massartii, Strain CS-259" /LENGTH=122 /DNA_ID=CAMNT_0020028853 /DNA_START=179 /DNA_END=547 /DNA_ORIENTATION=+